MNDYGLVFSVTTTGAEKLLYSFHGSPDGANPYASLLDVKGTLYGTTYSGGSGCLSYGCGTVFSVTTTGTEKTLYSFGGDSYGDGREPFASLINVNGTPYGTTAAGGVDGNGTVFSVTMTGGEKVLYSFAGGSGGDGAEPFASLIDVKGALYGTTVGGGVNHYGTVFSVTMAERVRYSFGSGSDGAFPYAALIDVNGALYGTTAQGGGSGCEHNAGCGSIFAFTP